MLTIMPNLPASYDRRFGSMDSSSLGFSPLASFIRERILRAGPVPFPWFMEQALYHAEYGYYSTPRTRIGRHGDFYTNASVGSTFGQIVAAQIVEMWGALGRPGDFKVIEQGAEDGQLAIDVLSAIEKASDPAIRFAYIIIEPIAAKQAEQRSRLEHRFPAKIQWVAALTDLKAINGVFISNELVDAMPVHLVEYRESHWYERYVTCSAKNFEFVSLPIASPEVVDAVSKLPVPVHTPYMTEVNLNPKRWINKISSRLEKGFILVVDYGYPRDEYYKPDRTEGTLTCYSRHRRSFNPLADPGGNDITAHVDFTSLAESAENASLHVAGYTDQHHFMVGATESYLKQIEREIELAGMRPHHDQFLRKLKTLMHPGNMGMAFKYLLLTKGEELRVPSGFRYAREPRRTLGLHKSRPGGMQRA
jgi:SAM-dependent MidA family methyltransferase